MQQIYAWIRDPKNNLFKGMTKRSALFRLFCQNPAGCDLYVKESTCLHCSAMSPCRFGRKVETEGPTRAARSFYTTLEKWRKENAEYMGRLKDLTAYNRVFRTNGYFYLPYSFMTGTFGYGYPLESKWVAEADMTPELLSKICAARPSAMMGGEITDYQKKELPKFISDLHVHYPEVFALLPEARKDGLALISYVGRKADITTCKEGEYVFADRRWKWDGQHLLGKTMLFQPVKGDIEIKIRPEVGSPVTITDNAQVGPQTKFLD